MDLLQNNIAAPWQALLCKCLHVPVGDESPVEEHERDAQELANDQLEGCLRGAQRHSCGRHPRHADCPSQASGPHLFKLLSGLEQTEQLFEKKTPKTAFFTYFHSALLKLAVFPCFGPIFAIRNDHQHHRGWIWVNSHMYMFWVLHFLPFLAIFGHFLHFWGFRWVWGGFGSATGLSYN